ncbi:MAG: hypothetical protein ACRDRI_03155 [Pseudonocardiaceae bacterium]
MKAGYLDDVYHDPQRAPDEIARGSHTITHRQVQSWVTDWRAL